jgi:hypothetical protein
MFRYSTTARPIRFSLALIAVALVALLAAPAIRAQDVVLHPDGGGTYTSPHYDYTLEWPAPWTVLADWADQDSGLLWLYRPVSLAPDGRGYPAPDGRSYLPPGIVSVIGAPALGLDLADCPLLNAYAAGSILGLVNPVPALSVAEPEYAAVAGYAQLGATVQGLGYAGDWLAVYVECRPLPDDMILVLGAVTWVAPSPEGGLGTGGEWNQTLTNSGMLNCNGQECLFSDTDGELWG